MTPEEAKIGVVLGKATGLVDYITLGKGASPEGHRASVEFLKDGKALISGLNKPDVSSWVHEVGHVARRFLFNKDVPVEQRSGITDTMIDLVEYELGVKDGVWAEVHEELFAKKFEGYIESGKAPSKGLARVFKAMSDWLGKIYGNLHAFEGLEHLVKGLAFAFLGSVPWRNTAVFLGHVSLAILVGQPFFVWPDSAFILNDCMDRVLLPELRCQSRHTLALLGFRYLGLRLC